MLKVYGGVLHYALFLLLCAFFTLQLESVYCHVLHKLLFFFFLKEKRDIQ